MHVVGQLLGYDAEDRNAQRDLARRAHQLSTDLDERPDDNVVQFTARVLSGNVRLLLGMIPRQPALGLRGPALPGAGRGSGHRHADIGGLGPMGTGHGLRAGALVLLAVMAIGAVSATLILGADLWSAHGGEPNVAN